MFTTPELNNIPIPIDFTETNRINLIRNIMQGLWRPTDDYRLYGLILDALARQDYQGFDPEIFTIRFNEALVKCLAYDAYERTSPSMTGIDPSGLYVEAGINSKPKTDIYQDSLGNSHSQNGVLSTASIFNSLVPGYLTIGSSLISRTDMILNVNNHYPSANRELITDVHVLYNPDNSIVTFPKPNELMISKGIVFKVNYTQDIPPSGIMDI